MSNSTASAQSTPSTPFLLLSDGVYNFLKWFVIVVLSAASAFYAGLAPVWGFPNANAIVTTISLTQLFLGAILGISTLQYNKTGSDTTEPVGKLLVDLSDLDSPKVQLDLSHLDSLIEGQILPIKVEGASQ